MSPRKLKLRKAREIKMTPEVRDALQEQMNRFREHFGREPGPNDPVFFNPDYHFPVPIDPSKLAAELARASRESGVAKSEDDALDLARAFMDGRLRVKEEDKR